MSRRACLDCKRCSRACPTETIDPDRDHASDPAECVVWPRCPIAGLWVRAFMPHAPGAWRPPWHPMTRTRRTVVAALGTAGLAWPCCAPAPWRGSPRRTPCSRQALPAPDSCLRAFRCGACVQVCPTGGLQADAGQTGLEGLWTPVLVPRLGYCDYTCNACGQVCPTGAIPLLSLADKQRQVIGQASIDRGRCLPWAGDRPCVVCEEMCPVPEKAIWLEEAALVIARRLSDDAAPPRGPTLCIGCGICENKCPLAGPAAIRCIHPA